MAFEPATNRRTAPAAQNDSWKAQGFLNLYLPKADGTRAKLGAISLKDSKPAERQLLEALNKDGDAVVKAILAKLVIEYRPAQSEDAPGFDLG